MQKIRKKLMVGSMRTFVKDRQRDRLTDGADYIGRVLPSSREMDKCSGRKIQHRIACLACVYMQQLT